MKEHIGFTELIVGTVISVVLALVGCACVCAGLLLTGSVAGILIGFIRLGYRVAISLFP